ncbi:MAG: hypothetical protein J7D61_07760 [Marichromatium sp.]|nr:hypothetical protein [Marichromatium sp.]
MWEILSKLGSASLGLPAGTAGMGFAGIAPPNTSRHALERAIQAAEEELTKTNSKARGKALYPGMSGALEAVGRKTADAEEAPERLVQPGGTEASTAAQAHAAAAQALEAQQPNGSAMLRTLEYQDGRMQPQMASFRTYDSPGTAAADWVSLMQGDRYAGVRDAGSLEEAIAAQAQSGYATDPDYGAKLQGITGNTPEQQAFLQAREQELLQAGASPVLAQLGARQAALETGWGQHAPNNNFYGIKASGGGERPQEVAQAQAGPATALEVAMSPAAAPSALQAAMGGGGAPVQAAGAGNQDQLLGWLFQEPEKRSYWERLANGGGVVTSLLGNGARSEEERLALFNKRLQTISALAGLNGGAQDLTEYKRLNDNTLYNPHTGEFLPYQGTSSGEAADQREASGAIDSSLAQTAYMGTLIRQGFEEGAIGPWGGSLPNRVMDAGAAMLRDATGVGAGDGPDQRSIRNSIEQGVADWILELAGEMKGALSDKDLAFLQKGVPDVTADQAEWLRYLDKKEAQTAGAYMEKLGMPPEQARLEAKERMDRIRAAFYGEAPRDAADGYYSDQQPGGGVEQYYD